MGSYYGLKSGYASKTRLLMFHPKVVIYFRLEVMLQIFLDHLVRHITRGHAKIAPRPEMPSLPVSHRGISSSTQRGQSIIAKADRLKPVVSTLRETNELKDRIVVRLLTALRLQEI